MFEPVGTAEGYLLR